MAEFCYWPSFMKAEDVWPGSWNTWTPSRGCRSGKLCLTTGVGNPPCFYWDLLAIFEAAIKLVNGLLSNFCHSDFCLFIPNRVGSVFCLFGVLEEPWRLILVCISKLDSIALRFWPANGSWLASDCFPSEVLNLTRIGSCGDDLPFELIESRLTFDCFVLSLWTTSCGFGLVSQRCSDCGSSCLHPCTGLSVTLSAWQTTLTFWFDSTTLIFLVDNY